MEVCYLQRNTEGKNEVYILTCEGNNVYLQHQKVYMYMYMYMATELLYYYIIIV